MNRREFNTLLLAGAATLAAAPARAEFEELRLQVAHGYPPGNIWYDTTNRYAEAVSAATGGKVTMRIAHSGSTGSWDEAIEALQIGTNDIVLESIGTLD